jgi:hypothetical protein
VEIGDIRGSQAFAEVVTKYITVVANASPEFKIFEE